MAFEDSNQNRVIIQTSCSPILWHPWMSLLPPPWRNRRLHPSFLSPSVLVELPSTLQSQGRAFPAELVRLRRGNAMGFWGHGIWGFLGRKKKNAWKKTLGVHIVLENNSVIILYSVIWCCMVNCQRRVLATLRYTSRNHFCIRFTQHIQGATSS